jgi:hypothetical protein
MTALLWDQTGTHFYETGVDRGVLYLPDGSGVPWNGLVNVSESVGGNAPTALYFDGVKYADVRALGEFSAVMRAYTYPDEFLQFEGVAEVGNGLFVTNQQQDRFSLSYRTKIGNEEDGLDLGYKIHVLYNLTATPSIKAYNTLAAVDAAITFEWSITAVPGIVPGYEPTAHVIFDSRRMEPVLLHDLEEALYGNEFQDAALPPLSTLVSFIGGWVIIRITDNGDGTWTAEGPDDLITMLNPTTFQIIRANARYLDADTYLISNTTY